MIRSVLQGDRWEESEDKGDRFPFLLEVLGLFLHHLGNMQLWLLLLRREAGLPSLLSAGENWSSWW